MKYLIIGIAILSLVGCKVVTFDVFTHPDTASYQKQFMTDLPDDAFQRHSNLVDSGILFIPHVRYLGWDPDYRAIIKLYSNKPNRIWVHRIEVDSGPSNLNMSVDIQKEVEITEKDEHTSFLLGHLVAFFGDNPDAEAILSADSVNLSVYYSIGADRNEVRKMIFHLKRKQESDIAWPT